MVGTRSVVVVLPAAVLCLPADGCRGTASGLHRTATDCADPRTVLVLLPTGRRLLPDRSGLRGAVDQGRAESGVSGAPLDAHSVGFSPVKGSEKFPPILISSVV